MIGLILGFITYVGWGSGDIFGVYSSRKIGAYRATTFALIFGTLVASFYIPFVLQDLAKITPFLFLLNFIFGVAISLVNYLINEAFKRSSASLVGIIIQSFPAIVLLLSALIFRDIVTSRQILWSAIIFSGVFFSTINFKDFKKSQLFVDSGIRLALIAAFLCSIYFTFFRVFSDVYGWFWPNYISFISFPVALIIFRRIFRTRERIEIPKNKKVLAATFFSGLLLRAGDIALNLGVANGLASIVTPIAGASPTLFITLSSLFFKDPITNQQKIGIGICLLGIVLLSFFP